MAARPSYASTLKIGAKVLGSAETSVSVPTATQTIFTAAASGSKIEELQIAANATTVAGFVYVYLHDGTTFFLFDIFTIQANTVSGTVAPSTTSKKYDNLVLPTGWSLRASQSIAGNANVLTVAAFGADF